MGTNYPGAGRLAPLLTTSWSDIRHAKGVGKVELGRRYELLRRIAMIADSLTKNPPEDADDQRLFDLAGMLAE